MPRKNHSKDQETTLVVAGADQLRAGPGSERQAAFERLWAVLMATGMPPFDAVREWADALPDGQGMSCLSTFRAFLASLKDIHASGSHDPFEVWIEVRDGYSSGVKHAYLRPPGDLVLSVLDRQFVNRVLTIGDLKRLCLGLPSTLEGGVPARVWLEFEGMLEPLGAAWPLNSREGGCDLLLAP